MEGKKCAKKCMNMDVRKMLVLLAARDDSFCSGRFIKGSDGDLIVECGRLNEFTRIYSWFTRGRVTSIF